MVKLHKIEIKSFNEINCSTNYVFSLIGVMYTPRAPATTASTPNDATTPDANTQYYDAALNNNGKLKYS